MSNKDKVIQKTIEILSSEPQGMRYSVLARKLIEGLPDVPKNTIHGTIWNIQTVVPEIEHPVRGLFKHAKFKDEKSQSEVASPPSRIKEEQFYTPFANCLVEDLEECTKAVSLGGHKFKEKWGTPDVIGVRRARESDIVKSPTEIVSAEIKIDTFGLITAFGQACSYKLFSHKSYIVIPNNSPEEDIDRLDSLALIFGIGLILFNAQDPANPDFTIRVRASRHEPDAFYVNKYVKEVEDELFG